MLPSGVEGWNPGEGDGQIKAASFIFVNKFFSKCGKMFISCTGKKNGNLCGKVLDKVFFRV
jgi:hypothetical protein